MKHSVFNSYQKLIIAILAFLQFTVVLDFMIMSPLGALLIPAFQISPSQFGIVVSAYALSAGFSGILAAGFADRFDRKKLLLFFYTGFILGTLGCGLAPNYPLLLLARMITGVFGGVIGSIVLSIATDLFPVEVRGRVMGTIQSAFSASQILGIPISLFLANRLGWHAPFFMIVILGSIAGVGIAFYMKAIRDHLDHSSERKHPFQHLSETLFNSNHALAFLTTMFLATGGYMLAPFSSAFSVNNVGISVEQLPLVYLIAGVFSLLSGPVIGKWSDTYGKFRLFLMGSSFTIPTILIFTHLGVTPLAWVILINAFMYVGISARIIASSALISTVPTPKQRGAFMAINSALQQLAGGLSSVLAGIVVIQGDQGKLLRFDQVGYIVVIAIAISTLTLYLIHQRMTRATLESAPV